MSRSPRTLLVTALLLASFASSGCSAESNSSHADGDVSAANDAGTTGAADDGADGVSGGSGSDDDTDTATDDAGSDPADDSKGESRLRKGAAQYLRDAARALHVGNDAHASMDETATGAALDAALAQAAEFDDNGWHQVGAPRIVSTRIVEDGRDEDPPRITISACVDSSDVDVVDASGVSVRHGSHPDRSRMLYTLVRRDGDWLVGRQTFPDDPEC